jgi:hypothetical protein
MLLPMGAWSVTIDLFNGEVLYGSIAITITLILASVSLRHTHEVTIYD